MWTLMQSPLLLATLSVIVSCAIIQCFPTSDVDHKVVTYYELESMNASCDPADNCRTNRSTDSLEYYNCMCGPACVHLDTCCVDSPFRDTGHNADLLFSDTVRSSNVPFSDAERNTTSSTSNTAPETTANYSPFKDSVHNAHSSFSNPVLNVDTTFSDTVRSAISSFSDTVNIADSFFSNPVRSTTSSTSNNAPETTANGSTFSNNAPETTANGSTFSNIVRSTTSSTINTRLDTTVNDLTFSNIVRSTTAKCLKVYGGKTFYMVDTCSPGWSDDGLVEGMCRGNGEDTSDPLLTVPVTNLKSGITYRNYFCGVCSRMSEEEHREEDLSLWNIRLSTEDGSVDRADLPDMSYNDTIGSWMMTSDGIEQEPVTITIETPPGLKHLVHKCNPDLISTCSSNWTDGELSWKCSAYMAKIVFHKDDGKMAKYRNPHCAICNHEDILERSCFDLSGVGLRRKPGGGGGLQDVFFVGLFVLEDRDESDKKKCSKDMVYDKFAKKCRTVRCPKGKVFRDRKCVLKEA